MKISILIVIGVTLTSLKTDILPNILIIGDSISIGYTPYLQSQLKGIANVVHNPGNAQHTGVGIEKLKEWLGNTSWDIIQFNWGLWDLCYRNPESGNHGNLDKINGQITVPIEKYRENLDSLAKMLRSSTNAVLIYVTTSYVPENEPGRHKEDAISYNNAAKEVMARHGIFVNDIYCNSISVHRQHNKNTNDVHFTETGYIELGKLLLPKLTEEIKNIK